jgi:N-6 DNA Methylase
VLPVQLEDQAENVLLRGERQNQAHAVLMKWADLETKGHLKRKETALDADFLREVFGEALGYPSSTQSPQRYHLEKDFTVPGIGTADGAIGIFEPGSPSFPVAAIELKGVATDLDTDRFNGRTPVQQCWDYLNALPDCPWGIVSNFVSFRLYHRNKTPLAYEEFHLQELRDVYRFRQFYYLFERDGLLASKLGQPPRALHLLESSDAQRLEVGDRLYGIYSEHRLRLIKHLQTRHGKSRDDAIRIAQKLLDRIIFIVFCEQRGLLPDRSLEKAYETLPPFTKVTNPRWRNFLDLFHAIDKGHESLDLKAGYNGGLFRHDPEVDDLQLDDDWTDFFHDIGTYDFRNEVNVDVLGHIFEKSIGELERLRTLGLFDDEPPEPGQALLRSVMPKSAERKRSGTYYTPPDFTRFLVRETVSVLIDQRREAIRRAHGLSLDDLVTDAASPRLAAYRRDCWEDLRAIKVCDPACGSGAFLIEAYEVFEGEYVRVADHRRLHEGPAAEALLDEIPDRVLNDNLHGVDLSEQAVEITQLALWIRSARRGKTLADLSHNIVWGNSLIDDLDFDWAKTFPAVFDRAEPGFDCVIGNPPPGND